MDFTNKDMRIIATLLNEEYEKVCNGNIEDDRFGDRLFDLLIEVNTYLYNN